MESNTLESQIENIEKDRRELAKRVIENIDAVKQSIGELLSDNSLELLIGQILKYINQEKDEQKRKMEEAEKKVGEVLKAAADSKDNGDRMEKKLDSILDKISGVEAEYEKTVRNQQDEYETKLINQKEKYEAELENQKAEYERELTRQSKDFDLKFRKQEREYQEQQAKKQKIIDEVGEDFRAYEAYKNWEGNGKKWLDMIGDTEFTSFLISCMDMNNICNFYQKAISIIQGEIEQEALNVISAVIDSGIRINNRLGKDIFSRQTIREGDHYDRRCHIKTEGGAYSGTVRKVYFQGIQRNGEVWNECKGYVEVAN